MFSILFAFRAAMAVASPAQTLTTLVNFNGTNGAGPAASLIHASDGNFYGTTLAGGNDAPSCTALYGLAGCGTVFKLTPSGTLTTLYQFCSKQNCPDGWNPSGPLVQGSDGNFYGTTQNGGVTNPPCYSYGCGTVFKLTPSGTLTTLYSFCSATNCTDGTDPLGGLIQGTDGNFYGTTYGGGANGIGDGTIFKITPAGVLTTLYSFCSQLHCSDGDNPYAWLLQANDGNFYGTTFGGGNFNAGTVFKLTPGGVLTTLHSFCQQLPCTDGIGPWAGLVQGLDGNFYGTAHAGGANDYGTVFKIGPDGTLTPLHSFDGTDGEVPLAGLIQATDGNFYGTTEFGGSSGACMNGSSCGNIFKMTLAGVVVTLHSFDFTDGASPQAGVVQGTDGTFYGTTLQGGTAPNGTIFNLNIGLGPFVELEPTIGPMGAPVTILGANLTGASSVTFNGTPATIITNTGSAITTTVPTGATTGTVQVTVGGNNLISNTDFQVVGPIQLVPVTPCRLVDTRGGNPFQGGTSQNFIVPQLGGCGIPTSAAAYSLNVTVVPITTLGYLTIWPEGEIQPPVSTMNSPDGRIKANAAIVPAGNNAVSVYVTDTTNVILDIDGYFASPSSQTYEFYPVTPCRVVDTRQTNFPQGLGAPSLFAQQQRDLPILSSPCLQGITNPLAYSFNVTVVPSPAGEPLGYLTVWPSNQTQPTVSTLNNPTATVVANAAIVPAAPTGDIDVYAYNSTDLIVDIDGYFAAPGTGGLSLYPAAPCRVLDTRQNNGKPFSDEKTVNVVGSACAPPSNAAAYIFNATVVPPGSMPFLTLWADGQQQPVVSTLNAYDGFITSNLAIVPTDNGSIDAYAAGLTQLILDISGYFAP
jgi:uncharacterized repeat protein (TIGR03803 family)